MDPIDWHGGNNIMPEHWQELVWQAHWFVLVVPPTRLDPYAKEDLYWKVAISGYSGMAVQVVTRTKTPDRL